MDAVCIHTYRNMLGIFRGKFFSDCFTLDTPKAYAGGGLDSGQLQTVMSCTLRPGRGELRLRGSECPPVVVGRLEG